jgi:hypothetical protein
MRAGFEGFTFSSLPRCRAVAAAFRNPQRGTGRPTWGEAKVASSSMKSGADASGAERVSEKIQMLLNGVPEVSVRFATQ